jgi:hypothetical protein
LEGHFAGPRFQAVEQMVGLVLSEEGGVPDLIRALRRLPRLLALLLPVTSGELRPDLVEALGVDTMRGDRWLVRLGSWVWCLLCGEGRLAPDVSGETVGRVLRALGDSPHLFNGSFYADASRRVESVVESLARAIRAAWTVTHVA